ncbi:pimeloyl-ACP methyl ester carboxylesterase [Allocatelliglobosispora scoriae]|uniref:Pimeloyl-ACP methyl ester carboxylesterase n=1 Tax=Allocatelliglobosispora scoriae TaxID=643052 RepID=A0A841BHI0_9ACTN|nr:alpha/beta hydrolase [Allocatelliglobosispora scoriae]MBB5867744.1 pimeloyl-ACP methyl ester carboxylesterase [Allocatelliglobosispora scoriae]
MLLSETEDEQGRRVAVYEHHQGGYRYESRVVTTNTPRLAPILLIGGAFQRKEAWGRLEQQLLTHADVVAVDPPGWGRADLLPPEADIDYLAETLRRLLDDLGLDRINIAGGSHGSATAFRFAQLYPDRLHRMVLIGAMTRIPETALTQLRASLRLLSAGDMPRFAAATVGLFMNRSRQDDVADYQATERVLLRSCATATAEEVAKYIANTRRLMDQPMIPLVPAPSVPTLIATGEHDGFTSVEHCQELAEACQDSWFAAIGGSDHMVHLERGADLAELMIHFYASDAFAHLDACTLVKRVRP